MPSYLRPYPYSATNRVAKFHRAVQSVLAQDYTEWRLIVVSDGCDLTMTEANKYLSDRVSIEYIEKQPTLSGSVRNKALDMITDGYVAYLDTDDYIGASHLLSIASQIEGLSWAWFNDYIYHKGTNLFIERACCINTKFNHGTSNIIHSASLPVRWGDGYEHDFHFIQELKKFNPYKKIDGGEYCVCHIPNRYDV